MEMSHRLKRRRAIGLEEIEAVGIERLPNRARHLLRRSHDGLEIFRLGVVDGGRVRLGGHETVARVSGLMSMNASVFASS